MYAGRSAPSSAYITFNLAGSATIDIKHIVNGAYKSFTAYSPYETELDKLYELSAGTWCREDSSGESWQVVGDDDPFPLKESAFATRYPFTLNTPEHGSISISTQYSFVMQEGNQVFGLTGNPVRLMYQPDSGCVLDTITVTDESGAAVTGDFAGQRSNRSCCVPFGRRVPYCRGRRSAWQHQRIQKHCSEGGGNSGYRHDG